jgi:hypothetical protein
LLITTTSLSVNALFFISLFLSPAFSRAFSGAFSTVIAAAVPYSGVRATTNNGAHQYPGRPYDSPGNLPLYGSWVQTDGLPLVRT